jgi:hypothetical protein
MADGTETGILFQQQLHIEDGRQRILQVQQSSEDERRIQ